MTKKVTSYLRNLNKGEYSLALEAGEYEPLILRSE